MLLKMTIKLNKLVLKLAYKEEKEECKECDNERKSS